MSESTTSREKILKKIRKAYVQNASDEVTNVDFDTDVFHKSNEPLDIVFAKQFSAINGKFVFSVNEEDFVHNLSSLINEHNWDNVFCFDDDLKLILKNGKINFNEKTDEIINANVGITRCECLVARTGSVFMTSKLPSGRRLPVYSNYHIVVAYTSQLVHNIKDALKYIKVKYGTEMPSMIANITGPSRTADIEKTLVQGAHGPKEIYVFLIDDHLNPHQNSNVSE